MPRGLVTVQLAVFSIAVTFACFSIEPVLPLLFPKRLGVLLAASALYAVPVWLWTAVFTSSYANRSANAARRRTLFGILLIAFNGFRSLPLIVFFGAGLPLPFAAVMALIVNTSDVLVSMTAGSAHWRPEREQRLSIAIACGLQAALALHYLDEPFAAAFAFAVGSAAMLSLLLRVGLASADLGSSYRKCVGSVALALVLSIFFTVTGRTRLGRGYGTEPPPKAVRGIADPVPNRAGERQRTEPELQTGPSNIGDGGFYGVILWPEIEQQTRLVAPLPIWHGASRGMLAEPTSIPFSGQYWMYRLPYREPPKNSYLRRGTPAKLFFRTTRGDPLMMEANQKLDLPIALSCCSRIQLSILDADPHPGSVLLELILIDSSIRPPQSMSLGKNMVGTSAVEQIMFPIPREPAIREFNEIKVIFHRDRLNQSRSARIAIEKFVLIPRGI